MSNQCCGNVGHRHQLPDEVRELSIVLEMPCQPEFQHPPPNGQREMEETTFHSCLWKFGFDS